MATEPLKPAPFIGAAHRHDLLSQLARTRISAFDHAVQDSVARGIKDPRDVKLDGKNGGLDGLAAGIAGTGIAEDQPYSPWQPPKVPKGKETKEGKDGKDQKDGKEDKEGKDSKDSKEQGKDSSDGGKVAGSESSDPFSRFGNVEHLNWSLMSQIARQSAIQVRGFIRSVQVF